jgi:hypothetical protein
MKMLVATLALATLLTSPALAQYGRWQGPYRAYSYPYRAFAQQTWPRAYYRAYASRRYNVYNTSGRYIGWDPDPRVRDMLARDPPGRY